MSDRFYGSRNTQGTKHIEMDVTLNGNGATIPLFGEGDAAGTYFSLTRQSLGNYAITTKDTFPGVVSAFVKTLSGPIRSEMGPPVRNANNTYTFPIYTAGDSGKVLSIAMSNVGNGYSLAPTVWGTGGSGTGLAITAQIFGGGVTLVITSPGAFYNSAPTIGFSGVPGGGGTLAAAAATLSLATPRDMVTGDAIMFSVVLRNSTSLP